MSIDNGENQAGLEADTPCKGGIVLLAVAAEVVLEQKAGNVPKTVSLEWEEVVEIGSKDLAEAFGQVLGCLVVGTLGLCYAQAWVVQLPVAVMSDTPGA